jgi:hypothetical protein
VARLADQVAAYAAVTWRGTALRTADLADGLLVGRLAVGAVCLIQPGTVGRWCVAYGHFVSILILVMLMLVLRVDTVDMSTVGLSV